MTTANNSLRTHNSSNAARWETFSTSGISLLPTSTVFSFNYEFSGLATNHSEDDAADVYVILQPFKTLNAVVADV